MSGKIFLDTNIIIYLLQGNSDVIDSLKGKEVYISVITELELLSYPNLTPDEEKVIDSMLSEFKIIDINPQVKNEVIKLRKKYRLKLPDTIILATSHFLNIRFLTADKKLEKLGNDVEMIVIDIKFIKYQIRNKNVNN